MKILRGVKTNRTKIRRVEPELPCEYCRSWVDAERNGFIDEDENAEPSEKQTRRKTAGTRKCRTEGKEVGLHYPPCKQFEMNKNFWCNRHTCWFDICVCIARQEKNHEDCRRCRQGIIISRYMIFQKFNKKGVENNGS